MIRKAPLETTVVALPNGSELVVPTIGETLRIKAFLAIRRNQTRDYLDIAALADQLGAKRAAAVLKGMDDFYADQHGDGDGIASQVCRQLSEPKPADASAIKQLKTYKRLRSPWTDWDEVRSVLGAVAEEMVNE